MNFLLPATGDEVLKSAIYRLGTHVCICAVGRGHVLLDLRRNRYYQVSLETPRLTQLARREPIELLPTEQSQPSIQPLIQAGLIERCKSSDTIDLITTTIDEPCTASDIPQTYSRLPRARDVALFVRSLAWTRWVLRRRSFHEISHILRAHRQRQVAREFDTDSVLGLVARFRQIRPWAFASRDQCLLHALTLVRFSMLHGLQASWVVGVMTQPWTAHSWAQYGNVVLDGNPEQVRPYRPILVV